MVQAQRTLIAYLGVHRLALVADSSLGGDPAEDPGSNDPSNCGMWVGLCITASTFLLNQMYLPAWVQKC